jgi:hypothetical protein
MPFDARDGDKNSVSDAELPESYQEDGELVIVAERAAEQWIACEIPDAVEVQR